MTVEIAITVPEDALGASAAIWIPAASVLADDTGDATVWIVDSTTMRVSRTRVELGSFSGAEIRVLSGLAEGDRIAVSGVHNLREGMEVRELTR